MKKKKLGIVASSVAAIAVCTSMVVGSTYALFTSEDSVNIAVTSGKVNLTATVNELGSSSTLGDGNALGAFSSVNGVVGINNIAPGDAFEFTVSVANASTVKTQYRTSIALDNELLASALEISVGEKVGEEVTYSATYSGLTKYMTEWAPLEAEENPANDIAVKVAFPNSNENQNKYQGQEMNISVVVEGVQANAGSFDNSDRELTFSIAGADAFEAALEIGGNISLTDDLELQSAINLDGDTKVNVNLDGHELTVKGSLQSKGAPIAAKGNSSLTLINGTITPVNYRSAQSSIDQYDTASVVLDNIVIEPAAVRSYCYGVTAHGSGNITISNSTIKSGCAVSTNASERITPTIIIDNSTLEGYATGLLFNVPGKLIVRNNSEISGINQGIILRAGDATVSDSTIRTTLVDPGNGSVINITASAASGTFNPLYLNANWGTGTQNIPLATIVVGCTKPNNGYDSHASLTLINSTVDESDKFIAAKEVGLIHHAILAWNYHGEENGSATFTMDAESEAKLNGTTCTVVGTTYSDNT